jgi:hypothetical protein
MPSASWALESQLRWSYCWELSWWRGRLSNSRSRVDASWHANASLTFCVVVDSGDDRRSRRCRVQRPLAITGLDKPDIAIDKAFIDSPDMTLVSTPHGSIADRAPEANRSQGT